MLHRVFLPFAAAPVEFVASTASSLPTYSVRRKQGNSTGSLFAGNDVRLVAVLFYVLHQPGKVVIEMLLASGVKRIHGHVAVDGGAVADFVSDEGLTPVKEV